MVIHRPGKSEAEKAPDEAKIEIPENVPGKEDKAQELPASTAEKRR